MILCGVCSWFSGLAVVYCVCVADCFGVVWCCLGALWVFVLVSVLCLLVFRLFCLGLCCLLCCFVDCVNLGCVCLVWVGGLCVMCVDCLVCGFPLRCGLLLFI